LAVLVVDDFLESWKTARNQEEICRRFEISFHRLERVRLDLGLPHRKRPSDAEVTPEEVEHRKAQCQARWTDDMYLLRSSGVRKQSAYEFPSYRCSEVFRD